MRSLRIALFVALSMGCSQPEALVLQPELAFSVSGEPGLTAARDLTVDESGKYSLLEIPVSSNI